MILKVARDIFSKRPSRPEVSPEVVTKEMKTLYEAIETFAGSNNIDLSNHADTRATTLLKLRTNLLTFVAFKNYNQSAEMMKALVDDKGNIRSWSAFEREAIAIGDKYNKNWLKAEYNTTVAAAQSAAQWADFERSKETFPYLIYKTQDDNKVRMSHRSLHDVAKHIDDEFWDQYYPPNGWQCRCYVLQSRTADGYVVDPKTLPDDQSHPPAFKTNPGKTGKIWNEQHPYFTSAKKSDVQNIWKARNDMFHNNDEYYDRIDGINVHFSNYMNDAFEKEYNMAKYLKTTKGIDVKMLPQMDDLSKTNPDYLFGGNTVAEFKSFSSTNYRNIEKSIRGKGGAIDQLTRSRHADKKKVVIAEVLNDADISIIVSKVKASKRMKDIELWIVQNGTLYVF
jgi:SPP1 gp7 family putative phage head morphogenesis protein